MISIHCVCNFLFPQRSLSYQRKAGDSFSPELLVIYSLHNKNVQEPISERMLAFISSMLFSYSPDLQLAAHQ
jgi:hypothetical protein